MKSLERSEHYQLATKKTAYLKSKTVLSLFFILILCLLDGVLTLFLVEKGAWEANPLMRYALSVGHEFFFFIKYFLTAGGFLMLLHLGAHRIFNNRFSVKEVAGGLVLFYEGLIIYELTLYHFVK